MVEPPTKLEISSEISIAVFRTNFVSIAYCFFMSI
jgi:hypothetical protein